MRSSPSSKRAVRKRLADGTVKTYYYDRNKTKRESRYQDGSIGALIVAYQISPEYRGLAPKTKKSYQLALTDLAEHQHAQVSDFRRRHVLEARDAISIGRGSASANIFVRVVGTLFNWAVEREWIDYSPVPGIKPLAIGNFPVWSEDQVKTALAGLPEHLRRVVILGMHTGQRRGDLIALPWSAFQGGVLRLLPEKTSRPGDADLIIPVHRDLSAELKVWPRAADTILTTQTGLRWIGENLSREMSRELQRLGLPAGLNIHGLRKLAATRLAQAGCTAHEIASITGHKTLSMVSLYTRSVDQERLARAAVSRLEKVDGSRQRSDRK